MQYFAHTHSDWPWELLEDHLRLVADGSDNFEGAAKFASAFGATDWGRVLGYWHDLGKYSEEFQSYLARVGADSHIGELQGKVDHSSAGAQHAEAHCARIGRLLAFCVAGHHAGLPDTIDETGGSTGLEDRLRKQVPSIDGVPSEVLNLPCPGRPPLEFDRSDTDRRAFQFGFFVRMLFSCLVDADFLATESFMRPDIAALRPEELADCSQLRSQLDRFLERFEEGAPTAVNGQRAEVLGACRQAAKEPAGFFSLQVPTGGGKTLSSLAFALRHAETHGLRRIIYAIPFTSIIEQTANVFRHALGEYSESVLEHHSNAAFEGVEDATRAGGLDNLGGSLSTSTRLAAENWDARVVVTTNVQLFESLFANRTSKCRKLHRIARSVIVLDEAQTLPVTLLKPTLCALQELVDNYGCTIVLCTATLPAIEQRQEFPIGLANVRPIIPNPAGMYNALRRVRVHQCGGLDDVSLTDRLLRHRQVLCIVNTRRHAAEIFDRMRSSRDQSSGSFHLSARMCPQHRTEVLQAIRTRLADSNQATRVISTQLIEAGVDIDLPAVYRAMAGVDSIAQAAGRCNREGKLSHGELYVFESEHRPPPFIYSAAQDTRQVLAEFSDPLALEAIEAFFQLHYWKRGGEAGIGWDRSRVMNCFAQSDQYLQFRTAAIRYRLITDDQHPIIVPYNSDADLLIGQLLQSEQPLGRRFDRLVQRFVVSVHLRDLEQLLMQGVLLQHEGRFVLGNREAYCQKLGLRLDVMGLDESNYIA